MEMIAGSIWGLGYMIFDAREFLQTTYIYGGLAVVAIVYVLVESIGMRLIEKATIERWGMVTTIIKKKAG